MIQHSSRLPMLTTPGAIGATGDHLVIDLALQLVPTGPPPTSASLAPVGSVSFRIADGDSDNSDQEDNFSIGDFEAGDTAVEELKAAAVDPNRVHCVAELSPTHSVQLRETSPHKLFNNFIDEMFAQLAKPHITESNETIYIKADRATVTNIARCYARANLLDLSLARQTRGYFIQPENLLTITVPTGLPPKATFQGEFSGTFASYRKTSWESVAKILAENCIRPASWATNELASRLQFPCYRFFGYSCEITGPDDLKHWPIKICTSNLYKIGKGQNPSGIIATCKTPKLIRVQSGGNDQLQRLCALQGIARGKDGATAMNSRCASVSYVASTHPVFQTLITRVPIPDRGSTSSIAGDAPEPPLTSTLTVPPTTEVATTDPPLEPAAAAHHRTHVHDDQRSNLDTSETRRRD